LLKIYLITILKRIIWHNFYLYGITMRNKIHKKLLNATPIPKSKLDSARAIYNRNITIDNIKIKLKQTISKISADKEYLNT